MHMGFKSVPSETSLQLCVWYSASGFQNLPSETSPVFAGQASKKRTPSPFASVASRMSRAARVVASGSPLGRTQTLSFREALLSAVRGAQFASTATPP